jgi:hypothetical protein
VVNGNPAMVPSGVDSVALLRTVEVICRVTYTSGCCRRIQNCSVTYFLKPWVSHFKLGFIVRIVDWTAPDFQFLAKSLHPLLILLVINANVF